MNTEQLFDPREPGTTTEPVPVVDAPSVPIIPGADGACGPASACLCGAALPAAPRNGGPRHVTCSVRCKRTRDRLLKQVRRREAWLRDCERRGLAEFDATEIARLRDDLARLVATLNEATL